MSLLLVTSTLAFRAISSTDDVSLQVFGMEYLWTTVRIYLARVAKSPTPHLVKHDQLGKNPFPILYT